MIQRIQKLLAIFIVVHLLNVGNADFITTIDVSNDGTFRIYLADDGTGVTSNTFGVSLYSLPLFSDGITSLQHVSPRGIVSDFNPVGFSDLRSSDNVLSLGAAQSLFSPHQVSGFGQRSGSLADSVGGNSLIGGTNVDYDAQLLIATGTWSETMPSINIASPDFLIEAYASADLSSFRTFGSSTIRVVTVPEPGAAAILFGVAAVGLFRRRKTMSQRKTSSMHWGVCRSHSL